MLLVQEPSAWRNLRRIKQLKWPVGRPRLLGGINLFHGYAAHLIAERCCVALATAHAYKPSRRKPGKATLQLLRLRRDQMILNARLARLDRETRRDRRSRGNEADRKLLRNIPSMPQHWGRVLFHQK